MSLYVVLNMPAELYGPQKLRYHPPGAVYHWDAHVVGVLMSNGWQFATLGCGVRVRHPAVRTPAEARKRISALGIDPAPFSVANSPYAETTRQLVPDRGYCPCRNRLSKAEAADE